MKTRQLIMSFYVLTALVCLSFLASCKPSVPRKYIQPSKMENILFDYHIADGMASRDYETRHINKRAYRLAVLKKHGVTEAEFDSSLVYYMRHTERLHKIYKNLSKRLSDEAVALGASKSEVGQYGGVTSSGDTANVWTGDASFLLVPQVPFNHASYIVQPDTAFHKGDAVVLNFESKFIYQEGMRDGVAVLSVRFKNDSVASHTMHISSSSKYTLQLKDDNKVGIKEIRGFFTLNKGYYQKRSQTSLQIMSISKIRLIRIHERKIQPKPDASKNDAKMAPDSLKKDSLKTSPDTSGVKPLDERKLPLPDMKNEGGPRPNLRNAPITRMPQPRPERSVNGKIENSVPKQFSR